MQRIALHFYQKLHFLVYIFGTILYKVFVLPRNGLFATIKWSFLGDGSVVAKSECILKFNAFFYGMYARCGRVIADNIAYAKFRKTLLI